MKVNTIQFVIAVFIFLGYTGKNFAQIPEFKLHKIGNTDQMLLGQSSLADLDKDGDLDFIVGASGSTVWWFEYFSADSWKVHNLGENSLTDKAGVTLDVNGDGNIDLVAGGTWYKNPGNPIDPWARFENGGIYAYDNLLADVNGDGINDVIAVSAQEGTYVYFTGSNPEKKWKKIKMGDGVSGGIGPQGAGDLDGDGDIDIVRSNIWFDNLDGTGNKWGIHRTLRFVESQGEYANSARVFVIDMDGDKDMDVVQTDDNKGSCKIAWHENIDSKGITWFTHPIDEDTKQDLHSLCVADFDNDGDLDIFSGAGPMSAELYKRCYIWENTLGDGTKWLRKEILIKMESFNALAADVDGDGDIDICSKTWKDDQVYFLQNMLIENKGKN